MWVISECDLGYRGINCSLTCPLNHYGHLCLSRCDCLPYQYCDIEVGCRSKETSTLSTESGIVNCE